MYVYQWISGSNNSGELNLDKAKKLALRAVELCPDSAFAHASLGWAYEWLHEYDLAVAEWLRAIELDASQADTLYWLSLNLAWSGKTRDAKEKIDCARRLNPLEEYYFPLGIIAYMEGDYEEAIELLKKLLTQDAAFLPGYLFLASSYGITGLEVEGKAAVQSLLAINPDFRILRGDKGTIKVPKVRNQFRNSLMQLGMPLKS